MPSPLLVVFGLNGSLIQRCRLASMNVPITNVEQHTIGIQKVFVRPGVKSGLQRLVGAGHSVGIWSGSTMKNTEPIVKNVFADVPFSFVWSRDHTSPDTYRRQTSLGDSDSDHATLKDASLLWRYKVAGDAFGPTNTVLVDDEPSKSRRFADNLLWVPSYDAQDTAAAAEEESLGFNRAIDLLLNKLADADDVRTVLPQRVVMSSGKK